jgi:hypothetical protein
MNQLESTKLLNSLLQQDASDVLAWAKQVREGKLQSPINFNWHGLAEAAAMEARLNYGDDSPVLNLSWAEVATSTYDYLAKLAGESGESFLISSMLLRAAMIAESGAILGHPVLDIDRVINWFFDGLKMSPDEAKQKATTWRNCSINEIRELRKIKNRLKVISVLVDSGKLVPNVELTTWLSLQSQLP